MNRNIFWLLIVFLITACCKVYCDGRNLHISFQKLKSVDTDSVLFIRYKPKTGLMQTIDSSWLYNSVSPADSSRSSLFHTISSDNDWKIYLPSINLYYTITDFVTTTEKCKCGGDKYKLLRTYKLNGITKECLSLQLD
jgi:hypothetical protein